MGHAPKYLEYIMSYVLKRPMFRLGGQSADGVGITSGFNRRNYEGGEFMCREKKNKLIRGDILLFPSNFMYPHEVKEITKGIRYSFVSWAF